MNIWKLVDMLKADPNVADDEEAFLKAMNAEDKVEFFRIVETTREDERLTSIAKMNGGTATAADIAAARLVLKQEPLVEKFEKACIVVKAEVEAGAIETKEDIATRISAEVTKE